MSGLNRFLSRRDKHKAVAQEKPRLISGYLHGLFTDPDDKPPEKDVEKKIQSLSKRLSNVGITDYNEPDIIYALRTPAISGEPEKAFNLLVTLEESEDGIVKEYDPNVKLLGAVNRHGVTCYLDSMLFAMFARLESFEAILYTPFEDEQRRRLATLLRLWVNTLRLGRLISTDITKQLQEALAMCGWREAAENSQQDASETFSFITEKLELPMLTLKMDIFHTGKEDEEDDHKYVQERLLEVAIPEARSDNSVITLEDCLETYFNSRIEVKRYLQRRATMNSVRSRSSIDIGKSYTVHIESVELEPGSPSSWNPQPSLPPYSPIRSATSHSQHPSIIQENFVSEKDEEAGLSSGRLDGVLSAGRPRAGSLRKEVMMPAWQFFSLIPWYTDTMPNSDAQVAAHFSSKRPVLGICLKRYTYLANGQAVRRGTHIDIPTEIGLPHFIHDDHVSTDGAAFGNFKLSLQSVVCHRGNSVNEGHYISLIRGLAAGTTTFSGSIQHSSQDQWMLFDDLHQERIRHVDILQALKEESPYLLFYQVQPIDGDPGNIEKGEKPPSYPSEGRDSGVAGLSSGSSDSRSMAGDVHDGARGSYDEPRGRTSLSDEGKHSVAFTDGSRTGSLQPAMATGTVSLSISRKNSNKASKSGSKSRPSSQSGENRLSASFGRLTGKLAKEKDKPKTALAGSMMDNINAPDISEETEKIFLKRDRENGEKGKHKGSQRLVRSKARSEKPDRECLVM